MTVAVVIILIGLLVAVLTWPRLRDALIRSDRVPRAWSEFAAAALCQGGLVKVTGYWLLLPFIDRQLPRPIVTWLCRRVGRQQGIDFDAAERPVSDYATLDAFFVRGLKPALRPIAAEVGVVVSPADGEIVGLGTIADGTLVQAKGMPYRLVDLLPAPEAAAFVGGQYLTWYLRPSDCHRVVCPVDALVRTALTIPGGEMPVAPVVRELRPGIYVHNKRLVHLLDGGAGRIAVVMVGAFKVGRMTTTYDPGLRTGTDRTTVRRDYDPAPRLARGEWMATFHLGSTVILLFEPGRFEPDRDLGGRRVNYGQRIGRWAVADPADDERSSAARMSR